MPALIEMKKNFTARNSSLRSALFFIKYLYPLDFLGLFGNDDLSLRLAGYVHAEGFERPLVYVR